MVFTVTDNLPNFIRDIAAGTPLVAEPGRRFLCARWNSSALVEEGEENFEGHQHAPNFQEALHTFARSCLTEFGFSSDMKEWADFGFLAKAQARVVQRWPALARLSEPLFIAFASLAADDLEFVSVDDGSSYSEFFPQFAARQRLRKPRWHDERLSRRAAAQRQAAIPRGPREGLGRDAAGGERSAAS